MTALDVFGIIELILLLGAAIMLGIGAFSARTNPDDRMYHAMRLFFQEVIRPSAAVPVASSDAIALEAAPKNSKLKPGVEETASLEVEVMQDPARDEIVGLSGSVLQVLVKSDPLGGDANRVVTELLTKVTGLPAYKIKLTRGHYQTRKALKLNGISTADLRAKLASFGG